MTNCILFLFFEGSLPPQDGSKTPSVLLALRLNTSLQVIVHVRHRYCTHMCMVLLLPLLLPAHLSPDRPSISLESSSSP
jgi:hypothetical protein